MYCETICQPVSWLVHHPSLDNISRSSHYGSHQPAEDCHCHSFYTWLSIDLGNKLTLPAEDLDDKNLLGLFEPQLCAFWLCQSATWPKNNA